MVFNTALGYSQPDQAFPVRPNFIVDFIQANVRRSANEHNEEARAKLKEVFLREEELVKVRRAWRPIVSNTDAFFVRYWWQRVAKQIMDRNGMLNSDGSTLPYRTKATLFRNNPYDHWLGLEPPQNLKVNWEIYL